MTDPEDPDPSPARYRRLLGRQARVESLLERLLEHDQRRERPARTAYAAVTMNSGREIQFTTREAQVLRLLATGRTNRQIAAQLQVSPGTIGNRLTRIYRELGVTTRTQAAVRAVNRGLAYP